MKNLLSVLTIGLAASSAMAEPQAPSDPRMDRLLGEIVMLHVPKYLEIPLFFHNDGTVSFIDIHVDEAVGESYAERARWRASGDDLCIITKTEEHCVMMPDFSRSNVVDTIIRDRVIATGETGEVAGQIVLVPGRARMAGTDAKPSTIGKK